MAGSNRRIRFATAVSLLLVLATAGWARAAITVTNTNDSGAGSLRAAITSANLSPTVANTINFSVSGTITLGSTLPAIANTSPGSLTIDGSGQAITISGGDAVRVMSVGPGATATVQNLTIAHGKAGSGAGIFNMGTLIINNCTVSNNTGAAIFDFPGSPTTITNSTIANNTGGDAIEDLGNSLIVTNSTFSGNASPDNGGTAISAGGLNTFITNCTFSGNASTTAGAAALRNLGGHTVSVRGSIFSHNTFFNCDFTITDDGFNISDDGSCGFTQAPTPGGTSINNSTTLNLDPLGLQNNGGPTNTIALEPNSQAVDFIPVASCTDQSPTPMPLMTDQRGFPRPDPGNPNFCDVGAVELQTTPVVISSNGERLQIARSTTPDSDQVNMAFTFTEIGSPVCDAADDAFNGFTVLLRTGSCGALVDDASLELMLEPWAVHTVNHQSYGTFFQSMPPETISARMVELPTPAAPACGEWTVNIEASGLDTSDLGNGPFALILSNADGDTGCFDVTNAIVGNQIDPPSRTVRRGARR